MSEEQARQLKQVIKDGVSVNKEGEVELDKNLEKEIAGGVAPEQEEGEEGCKADGICIGFDKLCSDIKPK